MRDERDKWKDGGREEGQEEKRDQRRDERKGNKTEKGGKRKKKRRQTPKLTFFQEGDKSEWAVYSKNKIGIYKSSKKCGDLGDPALFSK
jgi:hypothetical protein